MIKYRFVKINRKTSLLNKRRACVEGKELLFINLQNCIYNFVVFCIKIQKE